MWRSNKMHFTSVIHFWADRNQVSGPKYVAEVVQAALVRECDEARAYLGEAPDGLSMAGLFSVRARNSDRAEDSPWLAFAHHGGADEFSNYYHAVRLLDLDLPTALDADIPVEVNAAKLCRKAFEAYKPILPLGLELSDTIGHALREIEARQYAATELSEVLFHDCQVADRLIDDAPDDVAAFAAYESLTPALGRRMSLASASVFHADARDLFADPPRLRRPALPPCGRSSAKGHAELNRVLWIAFVDFHI
jgi:hypothetical protein